MKDKSFRALARTRKVGGSLVVTIPHEMVRALNVKANDLVEITVKKISNSKPELK